jgi:hypothetical protein
MLCEMHMATDGSTVRMGHPFLPQIIMDYHSVAYKYLSSVVEMIMELYL